MFQNCYFFYRIGRKCKRQQNGLEAVLDDNMEVKGTGDSDRMKVDMVSLLHISEPNSYR